MRLLKATALSLVLVLASACPRNTAVRIDQTAAALYQALTSASKVTAAFGAQGRITQRTTLVILLGLEDIGRSLDEFVDLSNSLGELSAANQPLLQPLIDKASASLTKLIQEGTLGIRDEDGKKLIIGYILTAQAALQTILVFVNGLRSAKRPVPAAQLGLSRYQFGEAIKQGAKPTGPPLMPRN